MNEDLPAWLFPFREETNKIREETNKIREETNKIREETKRIKKVNEQLRKLRIINQIIPKSLLYKSLTPKGKMIMDLKNLSKEEILELEKLIEEYKKSEKFLTTYKVTFYVKFNSSGTLGCAIDDPKSFGKWLSEVFPGHIMKTFNLAHLDNVCDFHVEEVSQHSN